MSIELSSSIDLNSVEVGKLIAQGSVGQTIKQDISEWDDLNLSLGLKLVLGSDVAIQAPSYPIKGVATARALINYYAKKKSFDFSEHLVDSMVVEVPATCGLKINHETVLFVNEEIEDEVVDFIFDKYKAFNDPRNANRYFEGIRKEIEDTFNIQTEEDFVSVRARWVLTKESECIHNESLLDELIFPRISRLIQDENGERYENQHMGEGYEDESFVYRSKIVSVDYSPGLPTNNLPGDNVVDTGEGQKIEDHINRAIKSTGSCSSRLADSTNKNSKKIATLIKVPQFKIIIAYKWVKIACVKTKIYYPKAQYRQVDHSLYTHWVLEPNVTKNLLKIIERCAIRAAITGAVVGIVLQNFAAAIATFKEKFKNCFLSSVSDEIECFFASIFIKLEAGDWKDI